MTDNIEADGTDFAHPAWWRGQDYGVQGAVRKIRAALDGTDAGVGVLGDAALEQARRDVLAMKARLADLERLREAVEKERSLCKLFKEAYLSWQPDAKILSMKRACDEAVEATDAALAKLNTKAGA